MHNRYSTRRAAETPAYGGEAKSCKPQAGKGREQGHTPYHTAGRAGTDKQRLHRTARNDWAHGGTWNTRERRRRKKKHIPKEPKQGEAKNKEA